MKMILSEYFEIFLLLTKVEAIKNLLKTFIFNTIRIIISSKK